MNPNSAEFAHASTTPGAGLALRRWLAQPHLGVAPGWIDRGAVGHSPLRRQMADSQLRRTLPAPDHDVDALQCWQPWLARPLQAIEADLMRVAALALQRQIRQCVHGTQRQVLIDTFGLPLYQQVMHASAQELQALESLQLPVPDWNIPQEVLACGLRLAHDVLHRASPYLARRLLLRFPADIALPPLRQKRWTSAACALASDILQQEENHDDH